MQFPLECAILKEACFDFCHDKQISIWPFNFIAIAILHHQIWQSFINSNPNVIILWIFINI